MANQSYFQDNPDAWGHSSFNGHTENLDSYGSERDKYFTKGKGGHYVLKDGYEQREQKSDSKGLGAVATYSNESSDHDDFETTTSHYGIYKKDTPAKQAAPAAKQAAPAKQAVPESQSQKIEPVTHSPEVQAAKSRVTNYQKKDYSSIFQQNETDYTSKFQPSASSDLPEGMERKDPQEFADKYKLDLSNSGQFN